MTRHALSRRGRSFPSRWVLATFRVCWISDLEDREPSFATLGISRYTGWNRLARIRSQRNKSALDFVLVQRELDFLVGDHKQYCSFLPKVLASCQKGFSHFGNFEGKRAGSSWSSPELYPPTKRTQSLTSTRNCK